MKIERRKKKFKKKKKKNWWVWATRSVSVRGLITFYMPRDLQIPQSCPSSP